MANRNKEKTYVPPMMISKEFTVLLNCFSPITTRAKIITNIIIGIDTVPINEFNFVLL
jgi:hypothetical protein